MMRKMTQAKPPDIESDFEQRVMPGMTYCQRIGNIMGATVFLSLASTIDQGRIDSPKRIGCFSYGSGCCSEFYSGVVTEQGQERQRSLGIESQLNERHPLTMDEYDTLLMGSGAVKFGTRNVTSDFELIPNVVASCQGKERLFLEEIREFHREYRWGI